MGDADIALAHLGPSTLLGRGLGAYIALMIAGARPDLVRGAVLDDGSGLAGGGENPGSVYVPPPMTDRRHHAGPLGPDRPQPRPAPGRLRHRLRPPRPAVLRPGHPRQRRRPLPPPVGRRRRRRTRRPRVLRAGGAGGVRRGLTRWLSSGCVGGAPAPSGRGGTRQGRGRGVRPPGRRGRKRPESHPLWLPLVLAPDPRVPGRGRSGARTSTRSAGTGLGYGGSRIDGARAPRRAPGGPGPRGCVGLPRPEVGRAPKARGKEARPPWLPSVWPQPDDVGARATRPGGPARVRRRRRRGGRWGRCGGRGWLGRRGRRSGWDRWRGDRGGSPGPARSRGPAGWPPGRRTRRPRPRR